MPIPRLSSVDDAGDAVRQVIRAYHGSPYDFDRFDASKIGTGEGAQTFGHGIYLAGKEDVGRYYRDSLSRRSVQTPDGETPFPEWLSDNMLRENGLDHYRSHWRDTLIPAQAAKGADTSKLMADLRAMDALAAGMPMKSSGRMYEVEVGFPEQSLLDWDRPMGGAIAGRLNPALRSSLDRGVRERLGMGQLERHAGNLRGMLDAPELAPGQVLHEGLLADFGAVGASKKLLDAGIPGIRYLDQSSRAAGRGTRNYVIFPGAEDQIRILRKYGMLAPIPAAAAMSGGE